MKHMMWIVALLALLLAACTTPEAESTAEPTEVPPATQFVLTRAPLPPTWTPYVQPTVTRTPTITPPPFTAMPTFTLPASCFAFQADYARIEDQFFVGTSPVLYWSPIDDASEYRVTITDPEGVAILVRWVDKTVDSFTVPAEIFELDEETAVLDTVMVYGWEVTPVDENRTGYCDSIGGELIPILSED